MKVLIVEDDAALGVFLQRGLAQEGPEVQWVGDGEGAVSLLDSGSFDLVVLDLGLPRRDGLDVLVELRARCQRTAVLVLTGRSDVGEKVKCLNLGADDCLMKPFSFYELRARCKALLRRREQSAESVLRHGVVELNRMNRRVTQAGREVELTSKEFSLLEYLLERRGQTCSRSELLREVWRMSPETGTNVVDVYINYLRKKLGDETADQALITTVRGAGYLIGGAGQKKPTRPETILSSIPLGIMAAQGAEA